MARATLPHASPSNTVPALEVSGLCKRYPGFMLDNVSFGVQPGSICGFIGRNGAGKTVTIKSVMGAVRPDAGSVRVFGTPVADDERSAKLLCGFALGTVSSYETKRLATVVRATRPLFPRWDEATYRRCLTRFALDERKRVRELSQGMRVKLALAIALSHGARLLVLDEPTSGLDPASRDELLGTFLDLVADGRTSVLFSTHITSDLDACADAIVHIRRGRIVGSGPLASYLARYRIVALEEARRSSVAVLGTRRTATGTTALVTASDMPDGRSADLAAIMTHMDRIDNRKDS